MQKVIKTCRTYVEMLTQTQCFNSKNTSTVKLLMSNVNGSWDRSLEHMHGQTV